MTTRSLKFQLTVWYAGLLTACLALLGAGGYLALEGYLVTSLKETQLRRARQIGQMVREASDQRNLAQVGAEVEARYTPGANNRFVRVADHGGAVLYASSPPADQNFSALDLPPPARPAVADSVRKTALPQGRQMLLASYNVKDTAGRSFLVETGAPLDEVQADLRQWLVFLAVGLPTVAVIAITGGYLLVRRALSPVARIAVSAERITSHNLSERLPLAQTGDELEQLALALNRMIGRLDEAFQYSRRFMADASHELRTPLTVLKGELESCVEEKRLLPELRERLGSALEEVERLVHIVEGLFAISRLDAGEAQAEWVEFDLGRLVAATADQMTLLAEDRSIRVSCHAVPKVCVAGDRARIKQVVVNLLDNAIKYTPPGGAVDLTVSAIDGRAVLEVADTGIGIPSEALPQIFDRFFRVEKARTRDQGGAGLGLAIVKSICTAHHGRVEARSKPGQGSRFVLDLPLPSPGGENSKPLR